MRRKSKKALILQGFARSLQESGRPGSNRRQLAWQASVRFSNPFEINTFRRALMRVCRICAKNPIKPSRHRQGISRLRHQGKTRPRPGSRRSLRTASPGFFFTRRKPERTRHETATGYPDVSPGKNLASTSSVVSPASDPAPHDQEFRELLTLWPRLSPELHKVVFKLPDLPEPIKAGLLAMVNTASTMPCIDRSTMP